MSGKVGADSAGQSDDRSRVRRRDRSKGEAWVRGFIEGAPFGFLATTDEDGQPFLNSNLFVYDGDRHCIYLHTHRTGRTRDNFAGPERVAFAAAAMGRLLPASEALEFSVEYAGVTAFGAGQVVEDPDESKRALQLLLDKYAPHLEPGRDYRATTEDELKRTAVYRIDIETWSGKQKEVPEDFPGAFDLPPFPVPFPAREADEGSPDVLRSVDGPEADGG